MAFCCRPSEGAASSSFLKMSSQEGEAETALPADWVAAMSASSSKPQKPRQKRPRVCSLSQRMRQASDLEARGLIDKAQKGVMKDLIAAGDERVQAALDGYYGDNPGDTSQLEGGWVGGRAGMRWPEVREGVMMVMVVSCWLIWCRVVAVGRAERRCGVSECPGPVVRAARPRPALHRPPPPPPLLLHPSSTPAPAAAGQEAGLAAARLRRPAHDGTYVRAGHAHGQAGRQQYPRRSRKAIARDRHTGKQ